MFAVYVQTKVHWYDKTPMGGYSPYRTINNSIMCCGLYSRIYVYPIPWISCCSRALIWPLCLECGGCRTGLFTSRIYKVITHRSIQLNICVVEVSYQKRRVCGWEAVFPAISWRGAWRAPRAWWARYSRLTCLKSWPICAGLQPQVTPHWLEHVTKCATLPGT